MEPCFLDAEFLQERVMAIGSVCASMGNLSVIHKRADISVRDTYSTIVSYDEGNADAQDEDSRRLLRGTRPHTLGRPAPRSAALRFLRDGAGPGPVPGKRAGRCGRRRCFR